MPTFALITFQRWLPRLAILVALLFMAGSAGNGYLRPELGWGARSGHGPVIQGELVVQFDAGVSEDEQAAVLAAHGLNVKRRHLSPAYVTVGVPPGLEEPFRIKLASDPAVQSAHRNALRLPLTHSDPSAPNDPLFEIQWNLALINVEQAWDRTRGAGVTVAVLDTGVAYEDYTDPKLGTTFGRSPDLAGIRFIWPQDVFANPNDDHPNDDFGHGTHVTGTIAQTTNNAMAVAGVAFESTIMPVKVCGPTPGREQPYGCPEDVIADGIDWAVQQGADIINLSLGGARGSSEAERQALERAKNAGIVVIGAAGNDGKDTLQYPAAINSVIAVGATGTRGVRCAYSNHGFGESKTMDLVAPGGCPEDHSFIVQNTFPSFCSGGTPPEFTTFATCGYVGTSMAAAHVSGVAALILSLYPGLNPEQVRTVLTCSAKDVGPPGDDPENGAGLLQAHYALMDSDQDGVTNCLDSTPGLACAAPLAATPTATPTATLTATPTATPSATPTATPTGTAAPETPLATPSETPSTPVTTPTPAPPTPSETPQNSPSTTPQPSVCGDVDCDGDVDVIDALFVLRFVAGLGPSARCLDSGHVRCQETLTAVEALTILRYVAALPLDVPPGCPPIGMGSPGSTT